MYRNQGRRRIFPDGSRALLFSKRVSSAPYPLISNNVPRAPGTAPFTASIFFSLSTCTTSTFFNVTRSCPILPAEIPFLLKDQISQPYSLVQTPKRPPSHLVWFRMIHEPRAAIGYF